MKCFYYCSGEDSDLVECDKCGIAVHEGNVVTLLMNDLWSLLFQVAMGFLSKWIISVTMVRNCHHSPLCHGFVMLVKLG